MTKKICLGFLFILVTSFGFSQDSTQRKTTHYLGIQANQLLKQLFNLSNSNAAVDNPYLITYSLNSTSNGSGLNLAVGYIYNQTTDGDVINLRETEIQNLFFRAGYEKKSSLGKRWIVSWGFDLVVDNKSNQTTNTFSQGGGGNKIETNTKSNAVGIGPRITLNYKITDRILLGTESTYYFKAGNNSSKVSSFGQVNETDDKFKQFQLTVPVAIYLIVKI